MDVVPANEPDWRSDPFSLTESDGRYAGRGTADMKGFLALAANRMAALDLATLRRPLALLFTYDEEVGTLGARRFIETFGAIAQVPRDTIIGEPTSLRVVRAHKGMIRLALRFTGKAAHSGYPHLGRSAIEPAAGAMVALAALRKELEAQRPMHGEVFPQVPFVALNIGTVAGGSAHNVIPDRCDVELGIRVLPGMTVEDIAHLVREAVRGAVDQPFALDAVSDSPALLLDPDAPIHRRVCDAVGQHDTHSVMFATDAGWLQRAGFDIVLFGPGSIEDAHRANEFLPIDEFRRAGTVLDQVIRRSCVEP
jgi:acetylornithine deacetylase